MADSSTTQYYDTVQGDTWDMISLDYYGDEHYSHVLMQANPDYITTLVFDAGIRLLIPTINQTAAITLPPWKRSA